MKELNDEQIIIVNDIFYKKKKSNKTITSFFNRRCRNKKNVYINVRHTNML
jgi:predicted nicotinamide N-methyase